tara:strand:+ start:303 stop:776 length:474 start_codon:yes stop_codon:yes gene_type:complete
MSTSNLNFSVEVPYELNDVFSFFSNPKNLKYITPSGVHLKIMTPGKIPMHTGQVIDYSLSKFFFTSRWRTLITDYKPPFYFVDVQLNGPFSFWHHKHLFEENKHSTVIKDEITYQIPLGKLGKAANYFLVEKKIKKLFYYRNKTIIEKIPGFIKYQN